LRRQPIAPRRFFGNGMARINRTVVWLLAVLLLATGNAAGAQSRRDILWNIVNNCLARDAAQRAQDCRAPRQSLSAALPCNRSTDVWDEAPEAFVAFRDIKMCACPENHHFIHGLALPFAKVRGVEDPRRPDGIWAFAWNVALEKIGTADKQSIGLAVNPEYGRTQDQLHVHIVRLRPDYLRRIAAHPEQVLRTVPLHDLGGLWRETFPAQSASGFRDFGVLVTSDGGDGYIMRVIDPSVSPEGEYTQWSCNS
jgi:CDP-diacylglycerol pyrophosphatase